MLSLINVGQDALRLCACRVWAFFLAFATLLALAPAAHAITASVSATTMTLTTDGACSAATPNTVFHASGGTYRWSNADTTGYRAGRGLYSTDHVHFFILDPANKVLAWQWRGPQNAGNPGGLGTFTINFDMTIQAAPSVAGDLRLVIHDGTSSAPPSNAGDTFTGSIHGNAKTFSGVALDSDCTVGPPVPAITSLSPSSVETAGGTAVVITGSAFTGATAVKFGKEDATSFTVVNDTTINAVAPSGDLGFGSNVLVTNAIGTNTSGASFTYVDTIAPVVNISGLPTKTDGKTAFKLTLTFSENIVFDATKVSVTNASLSAFTSSNSTVYEATITPNGAGDIAVSVGKGAGIDRAGKGSADLKNHTIALDAAAPSLKNVTTNDADPSDGTMSWTVEFSEDVSGVDPSDFNVEGTTAQVTSVTPVQNQASLTPLNLFNEFFGVRSAHAQAVTSTTYLVTISGGDLATTNGAVAIGLAPGNTITDAAGNTLGNTVPTGTNQTSVTVVNATGAPTLTIVAPTEVTGAFTAQFNFSENVTGFDMADIAVTNGAASNFVTTSASAYSAMITPVAQGGVTISVAKGTFANGAGGVSTADVAVTVQYNPASVVQKRTRAVIGNFLSKRANQIATAQPDLSGRLTDSGSLGATQTFAFNANGTERNLSINFGGNLTRLVSAYNKVDGKGDAKAAPKFNVWTKGSFSHLNETTGRQNFGVFHLGADYRINSAFLAGVIAQLEIASERNITTGVSASGTGWLVGPYIVAKLHDKLILDAQLQFGQSYNRVSPFGTYTDRFNTNRLFGKAQLTGSVDINGWTLSPQISALYYRETQRAYTNGAGVAIAAQTTELGQVTFGPKISEDVDLGEGNTLKPFASIKGIWNFKQQGAININTGAIAGGTGSSIRARAEAGASFQSQDGWNLNLTGFYDGIGLRGYQAYGASAQVAIPF